jgi:hypothetical protein
VEIFDSRNAGSGENQLGHLGVGLDGWVRTRSRRVKICIGSAAAGAVRGTATFLKLSIEVGVERDAHLLCCGQIAFDEGARRQMAFDPKGTVRAVIASGKGLIALGGEIEKAATHDGKAARLRRQNVQPVHLVRFVIGNMDERWNVAARIDLRGIFTTALVARKYAYGNT